MYSNLSHRKQITIYATANVDLRKKKSSFFKDYLKKIDF